MISGHATSSGTKQYVEKFKDLPKEHFRDFDGLKLSSIGMGTYLGNPDEETDKLVTKATKTSIQKGVNVIDTAINYRGQKAERSVGKALQELVEEGEIERQQLFVSSKNGYITNDADINEEFWQYIQRELVMNGVVKANDISSGYNCMSVPFLEDQLNKSLKNLGLECIDLMYMHNIVEGHIQDMPKKDIVKKLKEAFEFYEQKRREGVIKYYGMATWECFRTNLDDPQYFSLEEVVKLAKEAAAAKENEQEGFRFIQLPYNMYFDQALRNNNQKSKNGSMVSILEAAQELGIGVFTSIPLMQSRLLGQNIIPEFGGLSKLSHRALQFVRSSPGVIAPLVGHKKQEHVEENLELVKIPPIETKDFYALLDRLVKEAEEKQKRQNA